MLRENYVSVAYFGVTGYLGIEGRSIDLEFGVDLYSMDWALEG